jgi:uncharacterized membrane protein YoaK (UPF0700 family)
MSNSDAAAASAPDPVNTNADAVLRWPVRMTLLLAFIAGAADASDFKAFGVFTANQAGNLVLVWIRASEGSGAAWLSLFSLFGCLAGVSLVVLLRRGVPWLTSAAGSRVLLLLAAGVLAITATVSILALGDLNLADIQKLAAGSAQWWASALAVTSSALALAMLGTVFVKVGMTNASVISSTGPLIDSFRYATAALAYRDERWRKALRAVVGFPVAWTVGAAIAAFLPVNRGVISLAGMVIIVAIVGLSRRVAKSGQAPAT